MSDDDSSSVHEKPRGNLKIIKAWVTTPNLLQRELLDRIADQATKYDLVRDGEFVHQVRFVLHRLHLCHAYYQPCMRHAYHAAYRSVGLIQRLYCCLQCFGGGPMEPEVFRRQLQLAFHLKLTEAELAAVREATPRRELVFLMRTAALVLFAVEGSGSVYSSRWQAVRIFDKNKNGLIESDEFLKSFFEMGTTLATDPYRDRPLC